MGGTRGEGECYSVLVQQSFTLAFTETECAILLVLNENFYSDPFNHAIHSKSIL